MSDDYFRVPADELGFTPRELEVLSLKGDGLTMRQIGERLRMSRYTVADHLESARLRLHVSTSADAVEVAVELGLIPVGATNG